MVKKLLICILLLLSSLTQAQKITVQDKEKVTLDTEQNRKAIGSNEVDLRSKLNGTFQVVLSDPSHQFALNNDFFSWLDRSRKEDEDQYIKVDTFVTIYIPSKKTLASNDFVPLVTTIVKQ